MFLLHPHSLFSEKIHFIKHTATWKYSDYTNPQRTEIHYHEAEHSTFRRQERTNNHWDNENKKQSYGKLRVSFLGQFGLANIWPQKNMERYEISIRRLAFWSLEINGAVKIQQLLKRTVTFSE